MRQDLLKFRVDSGESGHFQAAAGIRLRFCVNGWRCLHALFLRGCFFFFVWGPLVQFVEDLLLPAPEFLWQVRSGMEIKLRFRPSCAEYLMLISLLTVWIFLKRAALLHSLLWEEVVEGTSLVMD